MARSYRPFVLGFAFSTFAIVSVLVMIIDAAENDKSVVQESSDLASVADDYGEQVVTNTAAAPQIIDMSIHLHSDGTYGVEFEASNLFISKDNVGTDHRSNQGHAKIYVNGEARDWVFGPEYSLGQLDDGAYAVEIKLVNNLNKQYVVNGVPVSARLELDAGVDDYVGLVDDATRTRRALDTHSH